MADKFAALSEGTWVRDALESNLAAGATLNAAGTTDGTFKDLLRPMDFRIMITLPTVTSTANSATHRVTVEASNDSTFADTEDVTLGATDLISGTDAAQSGKVLFLDVYTQKRYLRAQVTIAGTAPVYTGLTIIPVEENYLRQDGNTASVTAA